MQYTLSFLIPANNEMFLNQTIQDLLKNTSEQSEIIAVLDGKWANPPIPQHPRVNIIYVPESIGQRAAQNLACRLSKAKFVAKIDAHCSFDKDWDLKMFEGFEKTGDNVTMVPIMRNLWAFDWKCYNCGWKTYQGQTPKKCGWLFNKKSGWYDTGEGCGESHHLKRKMVWKGKERPQSTSYCFNSEPHFDYFNDYKHRPEYQEELKTGFTETMSLQGSCFMATRENYWKWELSDESLGNWGNQGIEVALATWFNGGRVLVNHNTWYAHMFRTQGGDFSFPWHGIKGQSTDQTKLNVKNKYWSNPKLKELLTKFWPVPGWDEKSLNELKQ